MVKRTTVEIDQELLKRAREALGQPTARATIHEALRRLADAADNEGQGQAERQRRYLGLLHSWADLEVMASEVMWR